MKWKGERKPLLQVSFSSICLLLSLSLSVSQDDGMSYVSGDVNTDKDNDIKSEEKGDSAVTQHQENKSDNFLKKYQSKLIGKVM